MEKTKLTHSAVAIAVGAAFGATALGATAADNPFGMQPLAKGYLVADAGDKAKEGKCGGEKKKDGSCGGDKKKEGSCGGDKKKDGSCGGDKAKKQEGKCGEGKCGGEKK